jgi:hypothetical protein
MEINTTYANIQNKIDLIKFNIEKNKKLASTKFNNNEVNEMFDDIQIYKYINKHTEILDLMSIPSYMIQAIKNNSYDIYLEYFKFIKSVSCDINLIKLIKATCVKINSILSGIIRKTLFNDIKSDISLSDMNDILELQINEMLGESDKEANIILYQLGCNPERKEIEYYKRKIDMLRNYLNDDKFYTCMNYILDNYIDVKDVNTLLLLNIDLGRVRSLSTFEDSIMNSIFDSLNNTFIKNLTLIRKYLASVKDIRKLLTPDSSNNLVKYDIIVIINNNLIDIINGVLNYNIQKIKHKTKIITVIDKHILDILNLIQIFAEDNSYLFIYSSIQSEVDIFKTILFDVLSSTLKCLYSHLDLIRIFEIKDKSIWNFLFLNQLD